MNLKKLFLQGNCFSRLPKSFERLAQLEEINLAGVPWVKIKTSNVLSYDGFRFFLAGNKMDRYIQANDRVGYFKPYELRCEKNFSLGFKPGLTQTGLYSLSKRLEA